jgi:hypothetical protein
VAADTPVPFSFTGETCYAGAFPWWPASARVLVAADLHLAIQSWLPIALVIAAIVLVILASLVSSALIIYHLRANAQNFSPKTYRMHVQLILLVILQASTYLFFKRNK